MLPPYNKQFTLAFKDAITGDIVNTLNSCFPAAVQSTKGIANKFDKGDILNSAAGIWSFVKNKINYVKDPDGLQIIQLPQATIRRALKIKGNTKGADCKSMSLLVSSLLHNLGAENVRLRYVSFRDNQIPTHVYTVFTIAGEDIPVDPVIDRFNYEKDYKFKKDYKMKIYTLSGIDIPIQQLEKMKKLVKPGDIHYMLIDKALTRERGGRLEKLNLNPIEYNQYKSKLEQLIKAHQKAGKLGAFYQLVQEEYKDLINDQLTGSISGIGKISIKKIVRGAKKISLAPTRNAFLGLLDVNMFGLASKLAAASRSKVESLWKSFGGDPGKLYKVIDKAKNKKPILGKRTISGYDDNSIGAGPGAAAVIAAAAPIVAAVLKMLQGEKGQPVFNEDGSPVIDPKTGKQLIGEDTTLLGKITNILPDLGSAAEKLGKVVNISPSGDVTPDPEVEITDKQPVTTGINKNLLIFGGAAILAAVLISRRK